MQAAASELGGSPLASFPLEAAVSSFLFHYLKSSGPAHPLGLVGSLRQVKFILESGTSLVTTQLPPVMFPNLPFGGEPSRSTLPLLCLWGRARLPLLQVLSGSPLPHPVFLKH